VVVERTDTRPSEVEFHLPSGIDVGSIHGPDAAALCCYSSLGRSRCSWFPNGAIELGHECRRRSPTTAAHRTCGHQSLPGLPSVGGRGIRPVRDGAFFASCQS